jgi:hypothetical protein
MENAIMTTEERLAEAEKLIRHAERRANEMSAWMVAGMSDHIRRREFDRFTRDRDEYRAWLSAPVIDDQGAR